MTTKISIEKETITSKNEKVSTNYKIIAFYNSGGLRDYILLSESEFAELKDQVNKI